MKIRSSILLVFLVLSACGTRNEDNRFIRDHARWQEERIERLKSKTGWLNLAGLYWLEEGENTFGSDSSNHIIFPEDAPAHLGKYIIENERIRFVPAKGSGVMHGDTLAGEMEVFTDRSGHTTLLEKGSLAWFIIDRPPRFGIRLRDYEHHAIEEFRGIETFPPESKWVIHAEFKAYDKPVEIMVPTVMGTVEKKLCPGILSFKIGDVEQELYPTEAGKSLFIIFADETSSIETYGGGRFLYIDKPEKEGDVIIDFNRAYNPPCAFTPFATCPLPPRENFLSVRIEAGEKFSGH